MEEFIKKIKQRGSNLVAATLRSRTPNKKGGFILKKPMAWNGSFLLLPAILVVIVCLASHCEKPINTLPVPINPEPSDSTTTQPFVPIDIPFEEYSLAETSCQWTNSNYNNTLVLIRSNEELENYISCSGGNYPAVDFSEYDLLLARGGTSSGIAALERQFQQISISGYSLSVNITSNVATVAQRWFVSIIVPKLSQNAAVSLNVNIHP